jgi:hypothetical protein
MALRDPTPEDIERAWRPQRPGRLRRPGSVAPGGGRFEVRRPAAWGFGIGGAQGLVIMATALVGEGDPWPQILLTILGLAPGIAVIGGLIHWNLLRAWNWMEANLDGPMGLGLGMDVAIAGAVCLVFDLVFVAAMVVAGVG